MWAVVVFEKENSISVVPECWLMNENTICCWPPVPNVTNYIINCKKAEGSWQIFGVRVLGNGKIYDNYLKARAAAQLAEETSDINPSESEGKTKRRRKRKIIHDDTDDASPDNVDRTGSSSDSGSGSERQEPQSNTSFPSLPGHELLYSSSPVTTPRTSATVEKTGARSISSSRIFHRVQQDKEDNSTPTSAKNVVVSVPEDLIQRLVRQQSVINLKITNIQADLTCIIDYITKQKGVETSDGFVYEGLPVSTLEEFQELDNFLSLPDNLDKFVIFVQKVGGTSCYESAKRILTRVMTDNLANKFCWFGSTTKRKFLDTNVQKGIIAGIRINPCLEKNLTEKAIEESIRSWLRHAKSRLNKKRT